jgi:N12 class adenine-specific DNA methylase/2'-5' RNA ligase
MSDQKKRPLLVEIYGEKIDLGEQGHIDTFIDSLPEEDSDEANGHELSIGEHKYACILFELPEPLASKVLTLACRVPSKMLDGDKVEARPHVTLKYGLHENSPHAARHLLSQCKPPVVRLLGVSTFPASESSERCDVVKIDVDSPDLHNLNHLVCSRMMHTNTHADYKPHITLCYVRDGQGAEAARLLSPCPLSGEEITFTRAVFADSSGARTLLDIGTPQAAEAAAGDDEAGKQIAESYARRWNRWLKQGRVVENADIKQAAEELHETGWEVAWDGTSFRAAEVSWGDEYPADRDDWLEQPVYHMAGESGAGNFIQRVVKSGPRKGQVAWFNTSTRRVMPRDWHPPRLRQGARGALARPAGPPQPDDSDDGKALARWYAELLNILDAIQIATEEIADDAHDELEGSGWTVDQTGSGAWRAVPDEDVDAELSTVGWELAAASRQVGEKWQGQSGRWFTKRPDGRVVPAKNPNAQPKKSIKERIREKVSSGARVSREELHKRLAKHAPKAGEGEEPVAVAAASSAWALSAIRMIKRHHGDAGAAHRLQELVDTIEDALTKTEGGDWRAKKAREALTGKLRQLHTALQHMESGRDLETKSRAGKGAGLPARQRDGAGVRDVAEGEPPGSGEGAGGGPEVVHRDEGERGVRHGGTPGIAGHAAGHIDGDGEGGLATGGVDPHDRSLLEPPTPANPTDLAAGNWRYDTRDFFAGGPKAKYRANIDAIRTYRNILAEGRDHATPQEQAIMSRFVGWGQFPALFKYDYTDEGRAWDKERRELQNFLTEEEYKAARESTLNAHYTHPDIVDLHWNIAQKLGFDGGRFLETSAGIGYYMGMMPPELAARTRVSAVEKDTLTGGMLKMLYPAAKVEVAGFQNHLAPDGFYDLIASNVPFGNYRVADPKYDKHDALIHDYFFIKSADKVRPGGVVMHITSSGTMDKPDGKIRKELQKKGLELVAAIRFPGDSHKENAGTSVVTDMLILRKKHPGEEDVHPSETPKEAEPKEPGFTGITVDSIGRTYHWKDGKRVPGPKWDTIASMPDPGGGEDIPVNQYFKDNPHMILGQLDRKGHMYGPDEKGVSKTEDYDQRLARVLEMLPAGLIKKQAPKDKRFTPEVAPAPGEVKRGGYHIKGKKLFVREGDALVEREMDEKTVERIAAHLELRDAMRECVNDQLKGGDADASRAKLNEAYDAFVKKWGYLNLPANKRAFRGDPDAPRLLALEKWDPDKKKADKSAIFTKTVVGVPPKAENVTSVNDAVGVSLHEAGRLDIARMGELLGWHPDRVGLALQAAGLAYEDPTLGWQPADQYLSGNVRKKLVMARAAAQTDPRYQKNVEALEKVQPADIDHGEIDVKLGANWVPPSDVASFAASLLEGRDHQFNVQYMPTTGEWIFGYSSTGKSLKNKSLATDVWATERTDFDDLVEAALNGKSITVRDRIDEDTTVVNKDETDKANAKITEIKEAFKNWVWEDDARRERLHRYYNDNFNNVVPMRYDGGHQTFPGMNPSIKLRDLQKNFVWQVVTTGTGLAAHEVGTGKTLSMIASAMELRRLGLARKPAIACLKANIEDITRAAIDAYPGANILSTADMFDAKKRKETISRIATGDYDLVLLTHDHLNLLPMQPEVQAKFIKEELEELTAAKVAAEEQAKSEGKKADPKFMKRLETQILNTEAKLEKLINAKTKDDAVYFEETGIDQLFVDEAHLYKSLPIYTKRDRVKGIPTSKSQRATNMLMRTRWLQEQNGGRGVVFATGTPIANTMTEMYTMQKYLQGAELKERGVWNFDAWANTFGDIVTKPEFTMTGEYKPVSRFAEYTNVSELMQIARQMMDIQRADDLVNDDGTPVIVRPKRKDHVIAAPMSAATEKLMQNLQARANALKGKKPGEDPDNMLVICSDGRKGAMDMRLLDAAAPDDPHSKVNMMIRKVLELHKARPGAAQMIFSNVGVNPIAKSEFADVDAGDDEGDEEAAAAGSSINGGARSELDALMGGKFHLYGDIIDKLVAGGIPRDKIADFSQLKGAKKEEAITKLKKGEMLVAIGSTEKLGTGVNAQDRLMALHHIDVPWFPAAVEQRDGRGHRQGNINDPTKPANQQQVDIYRYVSEGSLDQTLWQIIARKAGFISQVMTPLHKGGVMPRRIRDDDAEELSPDQIMAAASGDPRILEKVNLDDEVKQLKGAKLRHEREQQKFKDVIRTRSSDIPRLERERQNHAADEQTLADNPDFSLTLAGQTYTDRKEANEALKNYVEAHGTEINEASEYTPRTLGRYRGMDLIASRGNLFLRGRERYKVGFTVQSIDTNARFVTQLRKKSEEEITEANKDVERVKSRIGAAWPKEQELQQKTQRQQQLEAEIKQSRLQAGEALAPHEVDVGGKHAVRVQDPHTNQTSVHVFDTMAQAQQHASASGGLGKTTRVITIPSGMSLQHFQERIRASEGQGVQIHHGEKAGQPQTPHDPLLAAMEEAGHPQAHTHAADAHEEAPTSPPTKVDKRVWVKRKDAFRWQTEARAKGHHADVDSGKRSPDEQGLMHADAVQKHGEGSDYGDQLVLFNFRGPADEWRRITGHELSLTGWELAGHTTIPHQQGEVWQGKSGRWFKKKPDGHVVPAHDPHAKQPGAKRRIEDKHASAPVDHSKLSNILSHYSDNHAISPDLKKQAMHLWDSISKHHGPGATHRLEELTYLAHETLHKLKPHSPNAERLRVYLKQLAWLYTGGRNVAPAADGGGSLFDGPGDPGPANIPGPADAGLPPQDEDYWAQPRKHRDRHYYDELDEDDIPPIPLGGFELAAMHSPKGGVTIKGQFFKGGMFIPADVMAQASPQERAAVEGGSNIGGGQAPPKGGTPPAAAVPAAPAQPSQTAPAQPPAVAKTSPKKSLIARLLSFTGLSGPAPPGPAWHDVTNLSPAARMKHSPARAAFAKKLADDPKRQRHWATIAAQHGGDVEATKKDVASRAQKLVDGLSCYSRVSSEQVLGLILRGGFKNQFQTGTSTALFDPKRRADTDLNGLGLPQDTPPEHRPIYAYMSDGSVPVQEEAANIYGNIVVKMKPTARARATVSMGDSLQGINNGEFMPSPVDEIHHDSIDAAMLAAHGVGVRSLDDFSTFNSRHRKYIEAQIHGGVGTQDIESVQFHEAPSEETRKRLEELRIPWSLYK